MSTPERTPSRLLRKSVLLLVLIGVGLTMAYPLLWMVGTALHPSNSALAPAGGAGGMVTSLFPAHPHWENFRLVFQRMPFARYYANSIVVALVVTFGQVFTSSLAAYAFARLQFPGRDRLFFAYVTTMMIPGSITLIPIFIMLSRVGGIDSYPALILPAMFGAYGTFMLRQFFMGIPKELEEAAVIDGCTAFQIYWQIVFPLSKPALATLAIFTFLGNWKSLLLPLVLVDSDELRTIPIGLTRFMDAHTADWPLLMAASFLSIIPILLIFLFGQRYFVAGIRLGGVKG